MLADLFWPDIKDDQSAVRACNRGLAAVVLLIAGNLIKLALAAMNSPLVKVHELPGFTLVDMLTIPLVLFFVLSAALYFLLLNKSLVSAIVISAVCFLTFTDGVSILGAMAIIPSIACVRGTWYFYKMRKSARALPKTD